MTHDDTRAANEDTPVTDTRARAPRIPRPPRLDVPWLAIGLGVLGWALLGLLWWWARD